jgi:hypothetical protein
VPHSHTQSQPLNHACHLPYASPTMSLRHVRCFRLTRDLPGVKRIAMKPFSCGPASPGASACARACAATSSAPSSASSASRSASRLDSRATSASTSAESAAGAGDAAAAGLDCWSCWGAPAGTRSKMQCQDSCKHAHHWEGCTGRVAAACSTQATTAMSTHVCSHLGVACWGRAQVSGHQRGRALVSPNAQAQRRRPSAPPAPRHTAGLRWAGSGHAPPADPATPPHTVERGLGGRQCGQGPAGHASSGHPHGLLQDMQCSHSI